MTKFQSLILRVANVLLFGQRLHILRMLIRCTECHILVSNLTISPKDCIKLLLQQIQEGVQTNARLKMVTWRLLLLKKIDWRIVKELLDGTWQPWEKNTHRGISRCGTTQPTIKIIGCTTICTLNMIDSSKTGRIRQTSFQMSSPKTWNLLSMEVGQKNIEHMFTYSIK